MRLRNVPGSMEAIAESPYVVHDPEKRPGTWRAYFRNDNPVHLEIGVGKGRFIAAMAELHPDINYVGIEKYSSVLIKALEKKEEKGLSNLVFIRGDAELVTLWFGKGEVSRIYLNFSDPWPKKRTARRRLPSREFLRRYDEILEQGGTIEFKTDNRDLFDFAVEEVPFSVFRIEQITYDLHNDFDMNAGNIMTEYEARFSAKGNPIFKYILCRKEDLTASGSARENME